MAVYQIEWKPSAVKDLRLLPIEAVARIRKAVETLASNPFPAGTRKLAGARATYRVREGDYRVIYTVATQVLLVEVIKVRHRKDAYRG